jgi:hypothetical protein
MPGQIPAGCKLIALIIRLPRERSLLDGHLAEHLRSDQQQAAHRLQRQLRPPCARRDGRQARLQLSGARVALCHAGGEEENGREEVSDAE